MRSAFLGAATGLAVLLTIAPPASAQSATQRTAQTRVVYGWAVRSGNSAMSIVPRGATRSEVGESGLYAWELGRKAGAPLRIRYTGGVDFRQVNRTCGRPSAGYPYDTHDRNAYGTRKCSSAHLGKLLKGRVPVRVEYTGALVAVRVRELVLP
ncbi:hypothetical protein [Streptosporangium saharense]|uniref:hypothetical protein n=1 Tax=Streptosporangium saharense TaxID=1706840 RepID=UPI00342FF756